ncbi:MAG: HPP family protein [Hadesarchaea archaeon]|nr:HPP family protein [Hadesarchaea archaeon]
MRLLDEKIKEKWKNYLWQSVGAGASLILVLILFSDVINLFIVAAAGSTTFIVFALPNQKTARPRNVIGGHAIGVLIGVLCIYISPTYLSGGLAVGISTLLMVSTDSEHPPAAGTALGLSTLAIESSISSSLFILAAAVGLSIIRLGLLSRMENLM